MAAPVLWLEAVDSTNAEARRRAEAGEGGPLWIAAHRQTAGVGRRGRAWEAGEGNLTATLLITTDKPPAEATGVSFVAALAVAEMAAAFAPGTDVAVKWPNDVLLGGHKLAGVLVESGKHPKGLWLAIGIGVNLASAPTAVERPATSLAEHNAPPPSPDGALAALGGRFAHWMQVWEGEGLGVVLAAWNARAAGIPGPCTVRLGNETIQGYAEGLDEDGALKLRMDDGSERRVTAGDVFFGEG